MSLLELSGSDHSRLNKAHLSSFVPWLHVLKASGPKIKDYLQGQITQDVTQLSVRQGIYAAALTPQGKIVSDMYVLEAGSDETLMIVEAGYATDLVVRLRQFSLGFRLRIGIIDTLRVIAVQGPGTDMALNSAGLPVPDHKPFATACLPDKEIYLMRIAMTSSAGVWIVAPAEQQQKLSDKLGNRVDAKYMEAARILNGFPRFGIDFDQTSYALNANFIERRGVSFDKGCYVGQELTSRMHWRGKIKHKLYTVRLETLPISIPAEIRTTVPAGLLSSLMKSPEGFYTGIASLRIEAAEGEKPLYVEKIPVEVTGEVS
ncbi:MAG: YgfZ/GcvT domain-containing protein [Mariprofundaceae bacterium]